MLKKDYHTHTFRCGHATGDVLEYAASAIKKGLSVLGVTDHTPLPDEKWPGIRMKLAELESYMNAITLAQKNYSARGLTILKGMECEYAQEYHNFFQEELLGKWGLDYLIVGAHYFPCENLWIGAHSYIQGKTELFAYTKHLITSMSSGLFAFVAHPDLFGHSYLPWDANTIACSHAILEAAEDLRLPLEINTNGFRKPLLQTEEEDRYVYPLSPFWELASQYKVQVVVNSDAHAPEEVFANMAEGERLIKKHHLQLADLSYLEFS